MNTSVPIRLPVSGQGGRVHKGCIRPGQVRLPEFLRRAGTGSTKYRKAQVCLLSPGPKGQALCAGLCRGRDRSPGPGLSSQCCGNHLEDCDVFICLPQLCLTLCIFPGRSRGGYAGGGWEGALEPRARRVTWARRLVRLHPTAMGRPSFWVFYLQGENTGCWISGPQNFITSFHLKVPSFLGSQGVLSASPPHPTPPRVSTFWLRPWTRHLRCGFHSRPGPAMVAGRAEPGTGRLTATTHLFRGGLVSALPPPWEFTRKTPDVTLSHVWARSPRSGVGLSRACPRRAQGAARLPVILSPSLLSSHPVWICFPSGFFPMVCDGEDSHCTWGGVLAP